MTHEIKQKSDDEVVAQVKERLTAATACEAASKGKGIEATEAWFEAGRLLSQLHARHRNSKGWTAWVQSQNLNHSEVLKAIKFHKLASGDWAAIRRMPITDARRKLAMTRSQEDAARAAKKAGKKSLKAKSLASPLSRSSDNDTADKSVPLEATPGPAGLSPAIADRGAESDESRASESDRFIRRKPLAELHRLCASLQTVATMLSDPGMLDGTDLTERGAFDMLGTLQGVVTTLTTALAAAAEWAKAREEEFAGPPTQANTKAGETVVSRAETPRPVAV